MRGGKETPVDIALVQGNCVAIYHPCLETAGRSVAIADGSNCVPAAPSRHMGKLDAPGNSRTGTPAAEESGTYRSYTAYYGPAGAVPGSGEAPSTIGYSAGTGTDPTDVVTSRAKNAP